MALRHSHEIHTLATDLGIRSPSDPVKAILRYCEKRTVRCLKRFPDCNTLSALLEVMEASLDTKFEEVRNDDELRSLQLRYTGEGERAFAALHEELSDSVYGITFKRTARKRWQRQFVSVIDCRGSKGLRAYFTKWHELGHLLVLTDQQRLVFRRTHPVLAKKDPEEALVDAIASRVGFLPAVVQPVAKGRPSFENFRAVRKQLCPEASWEASSMGFASAWPSPCVLIRAERGRKRGEERDIAQPSFEFYEAPTPVLRAVSVKPNDAARKTDLLVFPNMRVPEASVINRVFCGEISAACAEEDLSWWESRSGHQPPSVRVRVEAKCLDGGPGKKSAVHAIVTPL